MQRSHLGYELNAGTKLLIQSILKRMLNNVSEFDIPRGIENIDIFTIETRSGCLMLEGGGAAFYDKALFTSKLFCRAKDAFCYNIVWINKIKNRLANIGRASLVQLF